VRSKLRIAILESQAPEEFTRPMAGKPMNDILSLCEFSSSSQVVVARSSLAAGMMSLHQRCVSDPASLPLLHLILPDRPGGFVLTSREIVPWQSLASALHLLNQSLGGRLHVALQSPVALQSLRAAFATSRAPHSVAGPLGTLTNRQAALALAVYAHSLSEGMAPAGAVEIIGPAVGQAFAWFGVASSVTSVSQALTPADLIECLSRASC